MPDIVVSEFMDETAVAGLARDFAVACDPTLADRPDALLPLLRDARALIVRNRTQVRGGLLAAAPRLLVVGRLGVGLDNIDTEACRARGIEVFPATGANDVAVAEYVIAAALLLLRGAWFASTAMLAGGWPRNALIGRELAGKVLGLVGFGSIAREVAMRARALGMETLAFDPYVPADHPAWQGTRRLDLDALLAAADVVSLHVPLTPETRHLIDAAALARMRADAVLINAARGGVVDEPALAAALRSGRLGGAALDVFETEPLTAAAGRVFADVPNLILTPHIAGVTRESNVRVSAVTAANVRRILERAA
jgi:(S)-sulfolactate dehydrogenase